MQKIKAGTLAGLVKMAARLPSKVRQLLIRPRSVDHDEIGEQGGNPSDVILKELSKTYPTGAVIRFSG